MPVVCVLTLLFFCSSLQILVLDCDGSIMLQSQMFLKKVLLQNKTCLQKSVAFKP